MTPHADTALRHLRARHPGLAFAAEPDDFGSSMVRVASACGSVQASLYSNGRAYELWRARGRVVWVGDYDAEGCLTDGGPPGRCRPRPVGTAPRPSPAASPSPPCAGPP